MRLTSTLYLVAFAAFVAGCATQPSGPPGKYLVYRDGGGHAVRQFDYPSEDLCARVEKIAGGAKCQPESASSQMTAQATLRYSPPGMLVHAYYPDMARCQAETRALGAGVELVDRCTAR